MNQKIHTTRTDKTFLLSASNLLAHNKNGAQIRITTAKKDDWRPENLQVRFELTESGMVPGDSKINWPFVEPTVVLSLGRIYRDKSFSPLSIYTFGGEIKFDDVKIAVQALVGQFKIELKAAGLPYVDLTYVVNHERALGHFVFTISDNNEFASTLIQRYSAIAVFDAWLGEFQVNAYAGFDEDSRPVIAIYDTADFGKPVTAFVFDDMDNPPVQVLNMSFDKDDEQAIMVAVRYQDGQTEIIKCYIDEEGIEQIDRMNGTDGAIEVHSLGSQVILQTKDDGTIVALNFGTGQQVTIEAKNGPIEVRKLVHIDDNPLSFLALLNQRSPGLRADEGTFWCVEQFDLRQIQV